MNRQHILGQLDRIFEEIMDSGPVHLSDATMPANVAGWDSLGHIQLIVAMERYFDIRFTSEEMVSWKNVGEIVDSILAQCTPHDEFRDLDVRRQRTAG